MYSKRLMLDNIINFGPPFLLLWPPVKNFLVFVLDPTRPCLDWQLRAILTSQPIYDPFKFDFEWRPKCKIGLNVNLPKNRQAEKIWNVPLDALMCPLQIINDIEPLSSTIHGLIGCFIHHPSNVKITGAANRPNQKKKNF